MPDLAVLSLLEGSATTLVEGITTLATQYWPKRILTYTVQVMPIFRAYEGFDECVQVKYRDMVVQSLYSCRVIWRNSGNVPLMNQSLFVQFRDDVSVLEENFETKPSLGFEPIVVDKESSREWSRRYTVPLINPGDEISADLTVAGELVSSDVTVTARGGGLKCLHEHAYARRHSVLRALMWLIGVVLLTGLLLVVLGRWLPTSLAPAIRIITPLYNSMFVAAPVCFIFLVLARFRRETKRLSYQITSPRPAFTTLTSRLAGVSVSYRGTPVENLHACEVELRNSGNRSLVNQGVLVVLQGATILDTRVKTEPKLGFEPMNIDHDLGRDRKMLQFAELEPRDKVSIAFVFEGRIAPHDVKVAARGPGLHVVCEPDWGRIVSVLATANEVLAVLILLVVSALFLARPLAEIVGIGLSYLEEFVLGVSVSLGWSPVLVAIFVGCLALITVLALVGRLSKTFGSLLATAQASTSARTNLLSWQIVIFVTMLVVFLRWVGLDDEVLLFLRDVLWPMQ